jgi:purine-cytosine permease-like protein
MMKQYLYKFILLIIFVAVACILDLYFGVEKETVLWILMPPVFLLTLYITIKYNRPK